MSDDVQALGRQMATGLYMLSRSVKIYSTDNAIFLKPLQTLLEQVNKVVALEHRIDLTMVGPTLYVNNRLIRVDQGTQENLKQLAHTLRTHRVGGFTLGGPCSLDDLRNFFFIFAGDQAKDAPPDDGLPGHKFAQMRLRRWAEHQEKNDDSVLIVDSSKALLRRFRAAYSRALSWAEYQTRCAREGRGEDATGAAVRIAQDLVDASVDLKGGVLELLYNGEGTSALAYHMVNTSLIAIAFGGKLGLSKVQLKDLAVAALTNETLVARLPPSLWLPADPDKLTADQQAQRTSAWRDASTHAMSSRAGSRLNQLRALSVVEMHESYLVSVRDAAGKVETKPKGDPLFLSRLLAIVAHFDVLTSPSGDRPACSPDQALGALWGPLRYRFDAELLWVFVRIMATSPLKVLPRSAGGIIDPPAEGAG